jgi:hypothetical protein
MERWFLQDKCRMSRFIKAAMAHVFRKLSHTLAFDRERIRANIVSYARAVGNLISPDNPLAAALCRCWSFVDGTFRRLCRPSIE